MSMTKAEAKKLLSGDFIPGGKNLSKKEFDKLKFRKTTENEVCRCGVETSFDPQSGPIYCGKIAEYIAISDDGGTMALCGQFNHKPPHRI